MREEFEAWAGNLGMPLHKIGDDYKYMATHHAWAGWQASRAVLCIDLPKPGEDDEDMVWILSVEVALEDAGVPYK